LAGLGFDVALDERWVDFREAARGVGVGAGSGLPGCATSDAFAVEVGWDE